MKEMVEVTYKKDTKRKHRYDGESGGISVGVYIDKGRPIPDEIILRVKK